MTTTNQPITTATHPLSTRTAYPTHIDHTLPADTQPAARVTVQFEVPFAQYTDDTHDKRALYAQQAVGSFVEAMQRLFNRAIEITRVDLPASCAGPMPVLTPAAPEVPPHPKASVFEVEVSRVVECKRTIEQVARYTHTKTVEVLATSETDAQQQIDNTPTGELFDDLMPRGRDREALDWSDSADTNSDHVDEVEAVEDDDENVTSVQSEALDAANIRKAIMTNDGTLVITEAAMHTLMARSRSAALGMMLNYAEALALYEEAIGAEADV